MPDEGADADGGSEGGGSEIELPEMCPGVVLLAPPPSFADCDAYLSEDVDDDAPTIAVEIVNLTANAILVPNMVSGCHHDARYFDVHGTTGDLIAATPGSACPSDWPECDPYVGGEDEACQLCATLFPPQRIEPRGRLRTRWAPRVVVEAVVPSACTDAAEATCRVGMRPPPGDYVARALAATDVDCPFACHEADALDADGSCTANDSARFCDFDLEASTTWDGTCEGIAIVFGEDPR